MPANRPERPIRAGQAYRAAIRDDPKSQAALARTQALLRAFGAGMQPIWPELAKVKRRYDVELAALAQKASIELAAERDQWKQRYGIPYPVALDDWSELAVRAGMDFNDARGGKWTEREVDPLIRGYLARLKDARAGTEGQPEQPAAAGGWWTVADLAKRYGQKPAALRARLRRARDARPQRLAPGIDVKENTDAAHNEDRYLYADNEAVRRVVSAVR